MRLRRPRIADAVLWRKQGDINALVIRRLTDDRDTIGELSGSALRLMDELAELRDEVHRIALEVPGYANARHLRLVAEARIAAERDAGPSSSAEETAEAVLSDVAASIPGPSSPSAAPSSSAPRPPADLSARVRWAAQAVRRAQAGRDNADA